MQKCLLILGMHRSGTSALTGLLNKLDIYLGSELMSLGKDNPKGFYENQKIFMFNEKVLKQLNCSWDDIFFSDIVIDEAMKFFSELKSIILDEFQNSEIFAIKDPRICLLFPLYRQVLTALHVDINVIIAWRNPVEVAASLKQRNNFSYGKTFVLWLKHFLKGEYYSRNYKRIFVQFDVLVQNPCSTIRSISDKLELNLSQKIDECEKGIKSFIDPDLKHHNSSLGIIPENTPKIIKSIVQYHENFDSEKLFDKYDLLRNEFYEYETLLYIPEVQKLHKTSLVQARELQSKEQRIIDIENSLTWRLNKIVSKFFKKILL